MSVCPHSFDFEDVCALWSPFLPQLTMQSSLLEAVCCRKLGPCRSYSRRGVWYFCARGGGYKYISFALQIVTRRPWPCQSAVPCRISLPVYPSSLCCTGWVTVTAPNVFLAAHTSGIPAVLLYISMGAGALLSCWSICLTYLLCRKPKAPVTVDDIVHKKMKQVSMHLESGDEGSPGPLRKGNVPHLTTLSGLPTTVSGRRMSIQRGSCWSEGSAGGLRRRRCAPPRRSVHGMVLWTVQSKISSINRWIVQWRV